MAKKKIDFDFKQFMLQKGERVGLGVAGGLAVVLLIWGVWAGLGKSSPLPVLEKNTKNLNDMVKLSQPDTTNPKIFPPPPDKPTFVKERDPNSTAMGEWLVRF